MPFDADSFPAEHHNRDRRRVARWLFVMCGMILVMIGLGGATRLTGSGLSIMEWAPIMGAIPPLGEAEWQRLYALYQKIPQYELLNKGFGIEGFKRIFWLEWTHRAWGRLIGVAFIVPLAWFAWRGMIGRRLLPRLGLLLVLGGAQGAVGWFMVASGFFPDSMAVSPYRLVVHLALALGLYAALLWIGLTEWRPARVPAPPGLRPLAVLLGVLVSLTILAGGFVAGLRAGLTYNSFPLMDGALIPAGYADLDPFWRNLTENVAAVQFDHRLLATLTLAITIWTALRFLPRLGNTPAARPLFLLAMAVLAQYALGVMTLLWVVPVALGTAHQLLAVLVLSAAIVLLHATRVPSFQDPSCPHPKA
ncbi:MAG: COX15/CtaA family protein [Alphaproteobacteria bacterium]|nr:COX15/CtaA family protein [Alphaproteobacteria bacterium]